MPRGRRTRKSVENAWYEKLYDYIDKCKSICCFTEDFKTFVCGCCDARLVTNDESNPEPRSLPGQQSSQEPQETAEPGVAPP